MAARTSYLNCPRGLANILLEEAAQAGKIEICGFVAASGNTFVRYAILNRSPCPSQRFEMDPEEQIAAFRHIRNANQTLTAIYHSHPGGEATPSMLDRRGHSYPNAAALLLAPHAVERPLRAWHLTPDTATEIQIKYTNARWYNGVL